MAGLPLGVASGYFGGWTDHSLMRFVDTLLSFPVLLLALTISAVLGPSVPNTILAIGTAFSPYLSRIVRGETLRVAALSFLGLGTQPPTPSWGLMIQASRDYLDVAAWTALVPGIAVAATVLGLNMLGDVLRDVLDPTIMAE